MRNLVPVFAGLAIISGIVSASMWRDLRAERQKTAELQTQLTAALGRPQVAVAPVVQPRRDEPPAIGASAIPNASEAKTETPAAGRVSVTNNNAALQNAQNALNQEKEMMKDPEYRKARLAQQRRSVESNYPGLKDELALSEKDADRLFDLLAENQINMTNEMELLSMAGTQDLTAQRQVMQRQQEDSVAALLGPGKYSQWQEYQQTRTPRIQAASIGTQLAQAGQPLSDSQLKSLTAVYITEQKRRQQETQATARSFNAADPQARAQMQEEAMKRQEESNNRILDAAASSLSYQQISTVKQQFEVQATMNRASQRARARVEAQNPSPQGAPAIP